MIPLLDPADPFPPVEHALADPNGLLAAGGGLGLERLIAAYAQGIFPWFNEGDPVLWWCPDPRMVLFVRDFLVSRSLKKRLRKRDYRVTADRAFSEVLRGCAAPRAHERGTWIVPPMKRAYEKLHAEGLAHSIEVWMDGSRESGVGSRESAVGGGESAVGSHEELVGGLYGVALGRMFFGESMYSRRSDASKIALVHLVAQLERWEFPLVDCQMSTSHLASLGARDISRREFTRAIAPLVLSPPVPGPWVLDENLIERQT